MRSDFAHVYNTATGLSARSLDAARVRNGRAPRDLDDLPSFQGIADSHRRGWDRRQQYGRYAFIDRWLNAQVGRVWDEVWSDICRMSDVRSKRTYGIRDDARRNVEFGAKRGADGVLRVDGTRYRHEVSGLHVDPEGILRLIPTVIRRSAIQAKRTVLKVNSATEFHCVDGYWYEISFRDLPPKERRVRKEADGSETVTWVQPRVHQVVPPEADRWGRRGEHTRHAYAKRQASGQQLREFGLVNDPDERAFTSRRRRGERH